MPWLLVIKTDLGFLNGFCFEKTVVEFIKPFKHNDQRSG